ncbi:MAG: response regulator transcription factor [Xanthobacteraceae bacterium]|jgi:FixJ family two-component response regulator
MLNHSTAKHTICVVDDDSDIRDGLKLLLESVGIACIAFSSTREFLQSPEIQNANCLILDVRLPGGGGLDLQDELTKAQIKTPIIFITAHGDIPMSVRAIKAGAVEFLTKPFREQDLLDAVRAALERDRLQRIRDRDLGDLQGRFEMLTDRERKVMTFVIAGLLNKQTAAQMGVSEVTVKVHRHRLMNKLGAKSLPELVRMAEILGVVPVATSKSGDRMPDADILRGANGRHEA